MATYKTKIIDKISRFFIDGQQNIIQSFVTLDTKAIAHKENWKKRKFFYGKSISLSGSHHEKSVANFSVVSGNKLPSASLNNIKLVEGDEFIASGLSVIAHPNNPNIPTSHMNGRIFVLLRERKIHDWWIGGGYDLTPYLFNRSDTILWHKNSKKFLDNYNQKLYKKFSKNCDEYFYLSHRNERRGVGGIFFDNFKFNDMDSSLLFLKNMFLIYQDTYNTIFNKRMDRPFSNLQRDFQLYRRGRYVEFNLLHDRGTKFGIQSNGRTESILGSLPPLVTWPNKKPKTIINMEQKLIQQTSKNWSKEIDT